MVVASTLLRTLQRRSNCQTLRTSRLFQTACTALSLNAPSVHSSVFYADQVEVLGGVQRAHQRTVHLSGSIGAIARQAVELQTFCSGTPLGGTTSIGCKSWQPSQAHDQAAQTLSGALSKHSLLSMTLPCCCAHQHLAAVSRVGPSSTLDLVSTLVAERTFLARGSRSTQSNRCQSRLLKHFGCSSYLPVLDWSTHQKDSRQRQAASAELIKPYAPESHCGKFLALKSSSCRFPIAPPAFVSTPSAAAFGRQLSGLSGRQVSSSNAQMAVNTTGNVAVLSDEGAGNPGGVLEANVLKALEEKLGSPIDHGPSVPPPKPLVIIISGPSGVGKDAVIKRLQERRPELHMVVTATSRPARKGEVHGKDYFFITKDEFQDMIDRDELLEHALVYGDYKGIPKQQVRETMDRGTDVVLRIDVQGAATVRSMLGSGGVFIFLAAESEAALVRRLVERKTESLEKALLRLETARAESKRMVDFDYVVVNADGQLDRTVDSIAAIIDAEKAKVHPREPKL